MIHKEYHSLDDGGKIYDDEWFKTINEKCLHSSRLRRREKTIHRSQGQSQGHHQVLNVQAEPQTANYEKTETQKRKEKANLAELIAEIKFLENKQLGERLMMKERLAKKQGESNKCMKVYKTRYQMKKLYQW